VTWAGNWLPHVHGYHSGGRATLAMDAGSKATFTFDGTSVSWIGYKDEWAGIAQVYLDGVLKATVDTYAKPFQKQALIYQVNGLANARHVLTIEVAGRRGQFSGGNWVWVDAFDVNGSPQPSPSPSPTPTPGPARYEENNPAVSWAGTWFAHNSIYHSGGRATLAMDAGSKATLRFTGTAVSWIGYRDEWSGIARVYLDGVLKATVDTYASPFKAKTVVYSLTGLPQAQHTLTIEVTGTRGNFSQGNWVWVDAFDVNP
jgi:hypothetical protein